MFLPLGIALARCNRDFCLAREITSQLIAIIIGFAPALSRIAESLKTLRDDITI